MDINIFKVKENEKPLDNIKETCGLSSIFKTIGVIGDSLASGEFESTDNDGNVVYHDYFEYSWPSILERLTGTKYNNYSRGGMTAKEFYYDYATKNNCWNKNQAYIIALGNNDYFVFGHPLGEAKDIDINNIDNSKDTFFGNLGRIINKLKSIEPRCRIFIVTPQKRGEEMLDPLIEFIANEMKKVVEMFTHLYLINMTHYAPIYDEEARKTYAMGFHPNPIGYYAYALMVGNYIDYIIRKNPRDFFDITFIGTDLKNKELD